MAFPVKQVRTLEERLGIIEEVGKTPSEKRTDVAKQLGLPPSTLNMRRERSESTHTCLWTRSWRCVLCCVWKKCVVYWEVEVSWRRCKMVVVVVMMMMMMVVMMKPSFTEALRAFESMRAFMYTHDITKRDQANIVNIESLLFKLKRNGATKQMKISDFLKKK
jgi:hypothetical protein